MPMLPTPVTAQAGRDDDERRSIDAQYAQPAGPRTAPVSLSEIDAQGQERFLPSGRPNARFGSYMPERPPQEIQQAAEGDRDYEQLLTLMGGLATAGTAIAGGEGPMGAVGASVADRVAGAGREYSQERKAAQAGLRDWYSKQQQMQLENRQAREQRRFDQAEYSWRADQEEQTAREQARYEYGLDRELEGYRDELERGQMQLEDELDQYEDKTDRIRAEAARTRAEKYGGSRSQRDEPQTYRGVQQRIDEINAEIQALEQREGRYKNQPTATGPDGQKVYERGTDQAGYRGVLDDQNELIRERARLKQRLKRMQRAQQAPPPDPRRGGQAQRGGQARRDTSTQQRGTDLLEDVNPTREEIQSAREKVRNKEWTPAEFETIYGIPYE